MTSRTAGNNPPADQLDQIPPRPDTDRRILKYHVPIGGEHTIELSIFGDIVHVDWDFSGVRGNGLAFWAIHNPMNVTAEYTFRVHASGAPIPSGWRHMGTFVHHSQVAWHLFVQGVDCRRLP